MPLLIVLPVSYWEKHKQGHLLFNVLPILQTNGF